jgi:hypothetical protein
MNKKLLLHLGLIGCLTGIATKCPRTFEEIRVAAESKTIDQVHAMIAKHAKSAKKSFLRKINRQLTDAYGENRTALLTMKNALVLKKTEITAIAQLEIAARQQRKVQNKPPQIFVQRTGDLFERDPEAKSYIHLKLPKTKENSPMLPLYSGTPFSVDHNDFRTWSERGHAGEAPPSYGIVTISYPTKAEADAGQRAVIIKKIKQLNKRAQLKTITE